MYLLAVLLGDCIVQWLRAASGARALDVSLSFFMGQMDDLCLHFLLYKASVLRVEWCSVCQVLREVPHAYLG